MKATAKMKEPERKCNGANRRRPPPPPLGNQRALGNEGGRPTDYRPEYCEQARKLCQLGATLLAHFSMSQFQPSVVGKIRTLSFLTR